MNFNVEYIYKKELSEWFYKFFVYLVVKSIKFKEIKL